MKNRLGGKSLKILKEQPETLNRRTYHHQKKKDEKTMVYKIRTTTPYKVFIVFYCYESIYFLYIIFYI